MQEDQTVSFSPMYVDGPEPWHTRLFVLYIFVVLVVFLVRVIQLLAGLLKLRRARKRSVPAAGADSLWTGYYAKAYSFKEISTLTFLASLLNVTWSTANVLLSVRTEKVTNVSYLLARVGDGLIPLMMGLIICIALYSAAMLFQAALRRRNPRGLLSIQDGREPESVLSS